MLGLGGLQSFDLLTLGQLLNCPLLEFADRINQVGPTRMRGLIGAMYCNEVSQGLQVPWVMRLWGYADGIG